MVESLIKERKSSINSACKEISAKIFESPESLRRRYYEMSIKLEREKLNIKSIQNRYGWTYKKFGDLLYEYKYFVESP